MAKHAALIILACALIISGALFGYYYRACGSLRAEIGGLKKRLAGLEKENAAYRKKVAELLKRKPPTDDSEDKTKTLRRERDELKREVDRLFKRTTALEEILKEREKEIKDRDGKIEALKDELLKIAREGEPQRPEPGERAPTPEMQAYIDDLLKRYDFTTLERLGEVAIPAFLDLLNEGIPSYRQRAAFTLGQIRDGRAVGPLATLLDDREDFVAIEAARALGRIGDPRAEDALVGVLGRDPDKYWEVQREAIISLRKLNSVNAIPALIVMARSGRVDLQAEANASLQRITYHYIKDPNLDALPSSWSKWWKENADNFEYVTLKGQEDWLDGNPLK